VELIALNDKALQYARAEKRAKITEMSANACADFPRIIYLSVIKQGERLFSDQLVERFKTLDPSME
jgi:hypothetical protein